MMKRRVDKRFKYKEYNDDRLRQEKYFLFERFRYVTGVSKGRLMDSSCSQALIRGNQVHEGTPVT
jgi:hypothetical protein